MLDNTPQVTFKVYSDENDTISDIQGYFGTDARTFYQKGLDGDSIARIVVAISSSAALVKVIDVVQRYIESRSVRMEIEIDPLINGAKINLKTSNTKRAFMETQKWMALNESNKTDKCEKK